MLADYEDERAWARKSLINIAKAGYFSSLDRTIEEYNRISGTCKQDGPLGTGQPDQTLEERE